MAFGDDVLKGFFGNDFVKDYTHASKTFRSNNSALSPRRKFLFHVVFNINSFLIINLLKTWRKATENGARTQTKVLHDDDPNKHGGRFKRLSSQDIFLVSTSDNTQKLFFFLDHHTCLKM